MKTASLLLEIDENSLNPFEPSEAMFWFIERATTYYIFNLQIDFSYKQIVREELETIVDNLRFAGDLVS